MRINYFISHLHLENNVESIHLSSDIHFWINNSILLRSEVQWLNMIKYVTFHRYFVTYLACHCSAVTLNISYYLRYYIVIDHKLFI